MSKAKKTICTALALTLLCAVTAVFHASATGILPGDVNGDGKVTSSDARAILRYAARIEPLTDETVADVDQNGKVNSTDARLALRIAAKIEVDATEEKNTVTELEPNMSVVTDETCPYCGKTDCPAMEFDAKLGVTVFKTENAELCPEYRPTTAEETTTEAEPIPEPCEYCGLTVGHLQECPRYTVESDPVYYCQVCHMPVGIGPDKCVQAVVDAVCPYCGELCKAFECHHCRGTAN